MRDIGEGCTCTLRPDVGRAIRTMVLAFGLVLTLGLGSSAFAQSNCCEANGGLGCDDQACEDLICGFDPWCCGEDVGGLGNWDAFCADNGNLYCKICGGDPGAVELGACCGSSRGACVETVESTCTANGGTFQGVGTTCADEGICESDACEGSLNDCCVASPDGTPGCNDPECCNTICACDSFCCETNWDAGCAGGGFGGSGCGAGVLCEQCQFDCTDTPAPPNDLCEDADFVTLGGGTLSHTFTGSNLCSSSNCADFPGGEGHAWISFELTQQSDVSLSYCGSVNEAGTAFGNAWLNLVFDCPCIAGGFSDGAAFDTSCPDGNLEMTWTALPAGTYYYPVMWDTANGASGDYNITVSIPDPAMSCAGNCFGQAPGGCWCTEDCADQPEGCCDNVCTECGTACPPGPCDTATNDCCVAAPAGSGTLGCNDPACCNLTCDQDSFCCGTNWDGLCAGFAQDNCEVCQFDCTDIPAPSNDLCEDADFVELGGETLSHTFTGSNLCSTINCDDFPTGEGHVWLSFELTQQSDVSLSYCGSVNKQGEAFGNAWLNLAFDCPCVTGNFSEGADFDTSCPDGNVEMTWTALPAGTYYYPVMWDPFGGASGDYNITVSVPDPDFSCAGNCFGQAVGGCWCTEDCADQPEGCCPDVCSQCDINCPVNCCEGHGGLGCNDSDCEDLICGFDPFCCGQDVGGLGVWDTFCADNANAFCKVCGGDPGAVELGACCGSTRGDCVDTVESTCTANGGTFMGAGTSCEDGGCPEPPDCDCQVAGGQGCPENLVCEECVCTEDSFCCESTWDAICVGIAGPGGVCEDACCAPACDADACPDLDGTGGVDVFDLLELLANWGECDGGAPGCAGDINCSGGVDVFDLLDLLAAWGDCPSFTCEGACGGETTGGCWCDEFCSEEGDCCEDFCEFCPDENPEFCAEPSVCGPGAGDCCADNGTPGCDDVECCEAVCACDPFCCGENPKTGGVWDGFCSTTGFDADCLCGAGMCGALNTPECDCP